MASSDDEGDTVPQAVSNYHFVNDKDEPITFAELPVNWNNQKTPDEDDKQIFLYGTADNGLQKVYKQVTAWKYDLSNAKPEILVLSKENNWIGLLKPRKSFEDMIRTILITVHCLHYLRKNPEVLEKALFDYLSRVLSLHEVRPSENDLVDHMDLIAEAVKRDEALAKSKFLVTFLEQKPRKREAIDEDVGKSMAGFITDDYMIVENEEDESSDEEADLFDSVCAICDNGGIILPCEGSCLRSFHATVDAGTDSTCDSLGLSDEQVDAIQNFFCKNCQYKQHQCFACGKLGSSNKSTGAEVFSCVSATCGRFYHPHCVAKLLHRDNEAGAEALKKKIAAGDSFTCPIHKCFVCKQGENKTEPDLQFAVCRRCPKSYHRKCLPRKIAFEDREEHGIIQRAWEGLIPDRILIYCLKHEIDDELGTPMRNHIKFPNIGQKKKRPISESRENVTIKERITVPKDTFVRRIVKPPKVVDRGDTVKKREPIPLGSELIKKRKLMKPNSKKSYEEGKPSLGDRLYATYFPSTDEDNEQVNPKKDESSATQLEQRQSLRPIPKRLLSLQPLDDDSKDRIKALMKDASSSVTLEEIVKQHKVPTTHKSSLRFGVDKTITLGKVEGSIVAIRAALQKLEEEDCSIEDAKAVCEPGLLNQIIKWKGKLRVYLAPFLFGPRYTSFGRHFTKVDKLKQIVEKVRWYVQDGDTVVDFCCGANDFSCLMKKRIDEMGKKCSYKNYDVLQAKNDFNFEKRDWMMVTPDELPNGSQLIMGLNPPFGVNASLANMFINKALEFRPKLVILIVPQETERLDRKKRSPYDLVWEDDELLAGKSFYLPGSVDINNKQIEQWNNNTPPLYLWSRPDWTSKHKAIAEQQGHISRAPPKELSLPPPIVQKDTHRDVEMSISDDNRVEKKEDTVVEVEQTSAAVAGIVKKQSHENGKSSSRGKKRVGKSRGPKVKKISSPGQGCSGRSLDRGDSCVRPNRSSPPSHDDITARSQPSSGYSGARDDDRARQYTNEDPYPNYTALTEYQGSSRGSGYRYMADEMSHARPFHGHADDHMMNQRSPYLGGALDSGYSAPYHQHHHLGSSVPANTSAMQRYAPRLDELNPYMNPYDSLPPRPGVQPDPMPFAPGQFGPYPPPNSSGWLNE
jgi:hypothetical protein